MPDFAGVWEMVYYKGENNMKKLIAVLLLCIAGISLLAPAWAEEAAPRLTLSETEIRLAVGKGAALKAAAENLPSGKKGKAAWESSDPAVCTVSASGAVKAVSEGTAVITCNMELPEGGTLTAECKVTAFVAAKQLKAVSKDIRVAVGETAAGELEILPAETTEKTLEWTSANEAIVTVDAEGKITGVAPGKTRVIAKTKDGSGLKAEFSVYVPTLYAGETEFTIAGKESVVVPFTYHGPDFEENVRFKVTGKPVLYTAKHEGSSVELVLTGLEAGDSTIEIGDKKDSKAKITLTVHTAAEALCDNLAVEIVSAGMIQDSYGTKYSVNVCNHTDRTIKNFRTLLDFRTENGEHRYYPMPPDGYDIPVIFQGWDCLSKKNLKPGMKLNESYYLLVNENAEDLKDPDVKEIRCAIAFIEFEDGTTLNIPDSQRYWYSTRSKSYLERPEVRENYIGPSAEVREKAKPVGLGMKTVSAESFTLEWYGSPYAGYFVYSITPDGIAEKSGVQLKDIIFEVDGVRFSDDPLFFITARAKLAGGETVPFRVYRNGEVAELAFEPAEQP